MSINVVARLTNTGVLYTNNNFDEITTSQAKISLTSVYANFFDEVSIIDVTQRITSNGAIHVSDYFDEVTGITNNV